MCQYVYYVSFMSTFRCVPSQDCIYSNNATKKYSKVCKYIPAQTLFHMSSLRLFQKLPHLPPPDKLQVIDVNRSDPTTRRHKLNVFCPGVVLRITFGVNTKVKTQPQMNIFLMLCLNRKRITPAPSLHFLEWNQQTH